jgi:hypothetical protein
MPVAQAIIGGVNLLAGVLGTLQSFLKVAETMESHRASGSAWSKLGRNISIELALSLGLLLVITSDYLLTLAFM